MWLLIGTFVSIPPASSAGKSSAQLRKEKAAIQQQVNQLRKERDVFQKEVLDQARIVDTATAEVSEVEQALADLELLVAEQRDARQGGHDRHQARHDQAALDADALAR